MEETITIYLSAVTPFLGPNLREAQRIVLRYLHNRGVEGQIDCDDQEGNFIRYIKPAVGFEEFSLQFYNFITTYQKMHD